MIKKYSSYIFGFGLGIICLLTCITGVRVIGASVYNACKTIDIKAPLVAIDEIFKSIDSGFTEGFAIREVCIDGYGLIQKALGKDIIYDVDDEKTVIKGSDNKLYFAGNVVGEDSDDDSLMLNNVENLKDFNEYLMNNGASLLFVVAPDKFAGEQIQLPVENITDYTEKSDEFCRLLKSNDVPNINLKSQLMDETDVYSDAFFITDHHWKIETAFWGFNKIMHHLVMENGYKISEKFYSKESYEFEVLPNAFLGSMGIRTGKHYVGKDDITVVSPSFDTLFDVEYSTKTLGTKIQRHGDYKEAILDNEVGYNMYITSDNPEIYVDNLLNDSGHNVLFIKDSFGVPVGAWLSCVADKTWIVDLRYKQEKSMFDFVKDNSIDTVIVMYNAQMLEVEGICNFSGISNGM